jgi:hypothetical protein
MSIFAWWGRQVAHKVLERELPAIVRSAFEKELEKRLPGLIEEVLSERFKNRPNDPLNEVGFNWALALSLRELWPDVPNHEAVRWLREYIEVPFGHDGYDWTPAAAKSVAHEYVNEVGELN